MNGFVTGQEKNNGVEIKSADNASGNTNIEQSQDGISKATPLKGSHYLVNGALFSCAMDTTGGNVLSQIVSQNNKVSLQNKPFVTINDTSFSNPFGLCMLQPTPSGGYCPCNYSLQWIKDNSIDHSKNTDLPTEKSKLKCQLGGLVSCLFHGQTQSVTAADFESANFQAANVINPFVVELESVQPEKYVEFGVSSIKAYLIDKDGKEKELKKGDAVRIGSTITLKAFAKQKHITDKHVSWALYQLVDFQNIIEQSSKQNSKTTKQEVKTQKVENLYIYRHVLDSFTVKIVKEGVYTVEGMGSGKLKNRPIPYAALSNYEDIKAYNLSYDKGNYVLPNKMATPPFDKSCSLELNIKGDNSIVGINKDGDNITDNSNNHIYIKQGKTFVLTPTLLFDFDKEFDELEYVIQKSNGNDTFEEKGNLEAASLEINPDVAEIDYKITFLLYKKGEDGVSERTPLSTCSVRMHSYNEAVLFAYVPSFSKRPDKNTTLRRVGDTLMFGVRKAPNGRELYEDVDEKNIKWSLEKDKKPQPFSQEGDRILCDFKAVGTYTIKADLSAVNLRNGGVKEQNDDSVTAIDHEASKQKVITHKLKISYNEVTEIKIASTNGIRYNGIKYRIDLSYLFENLAINEKVILSCDNTNVNITELTQNGAFQAKEPGEYTVKATIYTDGVKGSEKTVVANVYESTFSKWEFCDSKRNRITETGKNNMFGIQATVPAWAVSDDEKSCKRTICVSLYHKEYELKKIRTEIDEKGHFSIDDIDVKEHVVKKAIDLIPFFDAQTDFMITFKVSDHPASLVKGLQKSSKNELFTDACHLKVTNSLIIDGYFAHPNGKRIVDIMDYNDDVNVHLRMLNASEEQLKNMRLRVYENMSGLDPVVFEASEIELDKDGNADIPIKILPDKVSNADLDKLMFAGPSKGKSVSDADLDKFMFAEPSKGKSVSDADLDKLMYISETDLDKLKFPENEKLPRLFYFKIVELDQYGIIEKSKLSFIDDYGKKFEYPPYPGDLYGKNSDELKAIVENEKWDLLSFNSDIQKNSKARNYYYQLKLVSHKEDCKSFIKTYNQLAPVVVGEEMKEEVKEDDKNNAKCFCHRDFTVEEVFNFIKKLRSDIKMKNKDNGKEQQRYPSINNINNNIWEKSQNVDKKDLVSFTNELNASFKKYGINKCIQKITFLAQTVCETGCFLNSEETIPDTSYDGFKGRGLLQLTKRTVYETYNQRVVGVNILEDKSFIGRNLHYIVDSGATFFTNRNFCHDYKWDKNSKSLAIRKRAEKFKESVAINYFLTLNKLCLLMEKYDEETYFFLICKLLNGYPKGQVNEYPNGWYVRKSAFEILKKAFKYDKSVCIEVEKDFPIHNTGWHDPLDVMQICAYQQRGGFGPYNASFHYRGSRPHQGVDLFAKLNTPIYACLDGRIASASAIGDYGNVIVLAIYEESQVQIFKNRRKKNFKPYFPDEYTDGPGFNKDSDFFYLAYAHLSSFCVIEGDEVKAGDIIGYSGETGNAKGTKGPHVHFEVRSAQSCGRGMNNRCNPSLYFDYEQYTPIAIIDNDNIRIVSHLLLEKYGKKTADVEIKHIDGSLSTIDKKEFEVDSNEQYCYKRDKK